jgi:predicted anti-sigma-YlaC factor YlaD
MTTLNLTCERLVGLATKYLENTLAEQEQVGVELHLLQCPSCLTYLDKVRRTVRVLGSLRGAPPSGERSQALLAAFSKRRTPAP